MSTPEDYLAASQGQTAGSDLFGAGSELLTAAAQAMRAGLHPAVFNHTMRVLHLARHLAAHEGAADEELLGVAVLFHDAGTLEENNGEQRFELEGADAAARFLTGWDWSPERIRPVWEAITLHTSPGIAERFGPVARLMRTAVLVDLRRIRLPVASTSSLEAWLDRYPRLGIDRVLPDLVVAQALARPGDMKAPPFSWPGALVAGHRASAGVGRVGQETERPACPAGGRSASTADN